MLGSKPSSASPAAVPSTPSAVTAGKHRPSAPSTSSTASSDASRRNSNAATPATPALFAKPSAPVKKPTKSNTTPLPETPAPIRAIRKYTSDSDSEDDDGEPTPKASHQYLLQTPLNTSRHPNQSARNHDNDKQYSGSDYDSQSDDNQETQDLTMLPMHRKPAATPNQPDSTPTSSLSASTIPGAGTGKPTAGHLPKHMRARAQAGFSSPTDKIMSPVSTKLSRSSVPISKPVVGDLSPLFAKAKISDQKQQRERARQQQQPEMTPTPRLGSTSSSPSAQ